MLYTLHIILSTKMACICEAITEIQIKPHSVNQSVTHLLDETQLAPHTGCTTSTHWTCIRSHQHYHKYIESITKTNWIGCSLHGNPSSKTSLVITKRDCVLPSSTTLGPTDYRGHNFAKAPRPSLRWFVNIRFFALMSGRLFVCPLDIFPCSSLPRRKVSGAYWVTLLFTEILVQTNMVNVSIVVGIKMYLNLLISSVMYPHPLCWNNLSICTGNKCLPE